MDLDDELEVDRNDELEVDRKKRRVNLFVNPFSIGGKDRD